MISRELLIERIKEKAELAKGEEALVDISDIVNNIGESPFSGRIPFPNEATSPLEITQPGEIINVASQGNEPCMITSTESFRRHFHTGAHADTPLHLSTKYEGIHFGHFQYHGSAIVIDLREYFAEGKPKTITKDILERAANDQGIDYSAHKRLLFKTYWAYPSTFDYDGSHFNRESADYLSQFKNIVLVGIDSQSMDFYSADIHKEAHAAFIFRGIALLEGLRFIGPLFVDSPVNGYLQTVWNPYQSGKDARGTTLLFHTVPKSLLV